MTTRNYRDMSAKIAALCVQASIIAVHCRTASDQIAEIVHSTYREAIDAILSHLWAEADNSAIEADEAVKGCVHNAVNAERKATMVSEDFIAQEEPSYLETAERCLSLARDCATYCDAALRLAKQVVPLKDGG